jgi:hypothetical protein
LSRLQIAINVYVFAALGMFLLAVPWSPVWDTATTAYLPTAFGPWVRSGFVRGLVSGLGALNLLAAVGEFQDLVRTLRRGPGRGGEGGA